MDNKYFIGYIGATVSLVLSSNHLILSKNIFNFYILSIYIDLLIYNKFIYSI